MEILILKGKHGDTYFKYDTREDMLNATEKIYGWNRSYYNYPDKDKKTAENIDLMEQGEPKRRLMYELVWNRSWAGHEYETLETEKLQ